MQKPPLLQGAVFFFKRTVRFHEQVGAGACPHNGSPAI